MSQFYTESVMLTKDLAGASISTEMLPPAPMVPAASFYIELSAIDDNPWQTRSGEDQVHITKIADDIRARAAADPGDPQHGLLQVPIARPHPMAPGRYQLAFGHTRLAAFRRLANSEANGELWERFPLNVRPLADRDMAEMAARENAARKDLSAIETARAMQRLIGEFGLGQLEAGKIFGYTSQGAVSNLLRLLKLPKEIQDLVHDGGVPERLARQFVDLVQVSPKAVVKLAGSIAKSDSKEEDFRDGVREMIFDHLAGYMNNAPWGDDLNWPIKAFPASEHLKAKGLAEIHGCNGCPFHMKRFGVDACVNKLCWETKVRLSVDADLQRGL